VILFNYTGNIASLQVISSQAAPLLAVWFPHQLAGSSPRCALVLRGTASALR
jgi:hypothetical protein